MFTGIVEETGVVAGIETDASAIHLSVLAVKCGKSVKLGDSIAVNGCCLTVAGLSRTRAGVRFRFDLLRETWERTNLSSVKAGAAVNLERALAVGDRLGGHFVTGHVDATGIITRWERSGSDHVLEVNVPPALRPLLISKGSVAVDGISLTVANVTRQGFRIWIIPHTLEVTALRERSVGDRVNLEGDLLGKYVQSLTRTSTGKAAKARRPA